MPFYIQSNKLNLSKAHKKTNIDKNVIPNHINISTSNRLFSKNASTDRSVYSSQDPYFDGIGKFIRNPNCWINGVTNISCFSPAQLSGADWKTRAGTLITTKHIIQAKHYLTSILPGGTPLIFVDENNNVIRRNLMSYALDPDTDIAIGVLDSDVPSNIKIAKVLPTNFSTYIRVNNNNFVNFYPYLYSVVLDQEEKAILKLFTGCYGGISTILTTITSSPLSQNQPTTMVPDPAQFYAWSEDAISGDSGNPNFIIIDNELVILSTFYTSIGGPFISNSTIYSTINSLIESLSPGQGYSLTPVDLAAVYAKYS